jgi:hypothetical protein
MHLKSRVRLLLVLSLSLIPVIAMSIWRTGGQQAGQRENLMERVINKIQALQVISVEEVGDRSGERLFLRIAVLNTSDKGVVEYTFLKEDGSALTTSGATTGWQLSPGETDTVSVSLKRTGNLTLSAAVLEDGMGQGDPQEVSMLKRYRAGVEKQYKRALSILRQALYLSSPTKASALLETLEVQLEALPVEPVGENIPSGMSSGIHSAKQFIKGQIQPSKEKLKKSGDVGLGTVKADINRALEFVEKALAKFQRESANKSSFRPISFG